MDHLRARDIDAPADDGDDEVVTPVDDGDDDLSLLLRDCDLNERASLEKWMKDEPNLFKMVLQTEPQEVKRLAKKYYSAQPAPPSLTKSRSSTTASDESELFIFSILCLCLYVLKQY